MIIVVLLLYIDEAKIKDYKLNYKLVYIDYRDICFSGFCLDNQPEYVALVVVALVVVVAAVDLHIYLHSIVDNMNGSTAHMLHRGLPLCGN